MKSKKLLWVFLIGLIIFEYSQVYAEKVNKNLDLVKEEDWTTTLSGCIDKDGNYIKVGYSRHGDEYSYIVKYDKNGSLLWKKILMI